jgi:hypothetical protein
VTDGYVNDKHIESNPDRSREAKARVIEYVASVSARVGLAWSGSQRCGARGR